MDDEDEQGGESADWQAAPAFDGARWALIGRVTDPAQSVALLVPRG